jgi:2-C-methyl-D-erythritol 4-phosphate cytidylyltransferase/2-C-methyl-D-erythritol 2,4-cyclodiphosphate synthase
MKRGGKSWSFILMAAGSGRRVGGVPKQFRMLGGRPLWRWSAGVAEEMYLMGEISELVVVFPDGGNLAEEGETTGLKCPVVLASGGAERTLSVLNGLRSASSDFVMIHDAARPFLNREVCKRLMEKTSEESGAIPLLSSADSLKEFHGEQMSPVPRERIFRTQTPQAFPRRPLIEALDGAGVATDEASVWLDASGKLAWTQGDEKNFKITTDFDWRVAQSLVNTFRETRTGFGYDVHEMIPGRKLVLGGLEIPFEMGLLGHSDADVICHAISDALLGAAGLGDIGSLFPASDERYKDVDSTFILESVLLMIAQDGWAPSWIDAVLVAQVPRLGAVMPDILKNLGKRFTVYNLIEKINLKVKSGERVSGIGRAECMECSAVATIERFSPTRVKKGRESND